MQTAHEKDSTLGGSVLTVALELASKSWRWRCNDRLNALRLLSCLRGWLRGERDRVHPVRVPTSAAESLRHLARERGQLLKEVGQHRDRIRKLLRTVGCWVNVDAVRFN